ncbi:MAG: hypothetical protein IKK74_11075 [Clostridia bacterium]|nr:hypothetical protein [Clostridia bacterium]
MKTKRIFTLLFALIMAFSLASCGGEGEAETSAPEITEQPPIIEDTNNDTVDPDLHIVADGSSEWTLIRPEVSTEYEITAMQSLRNLIKEKYGITMKLDTDGRRMPGTDPEFQVLIGKTDEAESADAIAFIESIERGKAAFVIEAHEKRLVIVASNSSMYAEAIKYIEDNFATDAGITVPAGFRYTADAKTLNPSLHIEKDNELNVEMKEIYTVKTLTDANGVKCRIIQGACTDGEYLYVCLNDGASSGAVTAIVKTELATGKVVATYENKHIDHANDLTYNPKTNEILAVHNAPYRQKVSIFDAEAMELKEVKTLRHDVYAIEYDEDGDCYWFGISHGYDYARYDTVLKKYAEYKGFDNGFTKQGMDADDKYVYFVLYKTNCIAVYTKDGEYVRQIDLPVTAGEPENISHVGDTFYIVYNNPSWSGGIVYEVKITGKK